MRAYGLALALSLLMWFPLRLQVFDVLIVDWRHRLSLGRVDALSATAHFATGSIGLAAAGGRVDARSRDRPLHVGRWFTLGGD